MRLCNKHCLSGYVRLHTRETVNQLRQPAAIMASQSQFRMAIANLIPQFYIVPGYSEIENEGMVSLAPKCSMQYLGRPRTLASEM